MPAAIDVAPGIWRVPTTPFDLVNSFIVAREDGSYSVIDTGVRNAHTRVLAGLAQLRAAPEAVTEIILTHAHADHAGGAAALCEATGSAITAHPEDAGHVSAGTTPPRDQALRLGRLLSRMASSFDPAPVARTMVDGELLPGSGLRVHHTPGHTPGHCSLLHEETGTLITGDSIWNMASRRTWPVLAFCTDAALTQQTAATLADLDYVTAAFTHGPEIRGTGREAVRHFLAHPRRFSR